MVPLVRKESDLNTCIIHGIHRLHASGLGNSRFLHSHPWRSWMNDPHQGLTVVECLANILFWYRTVWAQISSSCKTMLFSFKKQAFKPASSAGRVFSQLLIPTSCWPLSQSEHFLYCLVGSTLSDFAFSLHDSFVSDLNACTGSLQLHVRPLTEPL